MTLVIIHFNRAGTHVTSDTVIFKNNEVGETPEGYNTLTPKISIYDTNEVVSCSTSN